MYGSSIRTSQLIVGLFILCLGLLFLFDSLDVLRARDFLRYWPSALVLVGVITLVQARTGSGRAAGAIWIAVGLVLLLGTLGLLRIRTVWPLVLVAVGLLIVWQAVSRRARVEVTETEHTIKALAVLGGIERTSAASDFRGGELSAILGGCDVDLTRATIAGTEASLETFACMGGITIRVPAEWAVVSRVVPVLGGVDDKTRPPQGPDAPRLVLQGSVIMGGLEVKN